MLRDLFVRNLAVISEATVEFDHGLNVLTGETGAGKSIVVDALTLLRGARATGDLLRTGTDRLVVTGRFDPHPGVSKVLADAGLDADETEFVVRREISAEGRNRAFINDQPATLKLLRDATEPILHIHAQREELGLAAPDTQRAFVDASGGREAEGLLRATAAAHETYSALAERLARVRGDRRLHVERVDLLRFQIREIEDAGLSPGEDDALSTERDRLRNSEEIAAAFGHGYLALSEEDDAVVERLARVEHELEKVAEWEPEVGAWLEELAEVRIRLSELADTLRRRLDKVAADPRRLDQVEERLTAIDRLRRKYGESVDEVLAYGRRGMAELEQLESDMADSSALEEDVAAALAAYTAAATRLSEGRKEWARTLVGAAEEQFGDLALGQARLSVESSVEALGQSPFSVDGRGVQFGPGGFDRIELFLAANPGEQARPLATSASGGELSRIYLALRLAVQQPGTSGMTMVFDEADAGLGGEAARALGRKLQRLGRSGQILAVTHLPQVASFADHHFAVRKAVARGRTRTTVELLAEERRIEEIARMLAGDRRTAVSLSHAQELIAASRD
jgi:DNA repair protein RecN (Recombination protein N)